MITAALLLAGLALGQAAFARLTGDFSAQAGLARIHAMLRALVAAASR